MNTLSTIYPDFLSPFQPSAESPRDQAQGNEGVNKGARHQAQSAQQMRIKALQKESQDVTLTTEEGDKVTISLMSKFQAEYMAFDYTGQVKGASAAIQGEKLSALSTNQFQMTVEGDLNEEEQKDIRKIMDDLNGIMNDFLAGDLEEVMQNAVGLLDDTDTIASLNAVLQYQRQVSTEYQSVTRVSGTHPGGQRPPHARGIGDLKAASNLVAKITDQMMEVLENSKFEPGQLTAPIQKLFDNMLEGFDRNTPKGQLQNQLLEQLNQDLLSQLNPQEMSNETNAEAATENNGAEIG